MRSALTATVLLAAGAAPLYREEVEKWRAQREAGLKAPDGWLTVAGLFWLHDGENAVGGDPSAEVVLPAGRAPARLGVFEFRNGMTSFRPAAVGGLTLNGKAVTGSAEMKADKSGNPDVLRFGDFTMFVIQRGEKYGIRMKDRNSEMRRNFTGLKWYPVKDSYRIVARFVPYEQAQKIAVPNILGQTDYEASPGYAIFTLEGQEFRLDPTTEGNQLFFVFRDLTSAKTTYGAGRFLYTDQPKEGRVVLDFNKAYNPPCAFTPYATCPLPPKQNRLKVAIEAGEMKYDDH